MTEEVSADSPPIVRIQQHERIGIDTLLKFIDTYDGNRDDLSSWLTNCDRAFTLAQEDLRFILFTNILNQLKDKAQATCSNAVFKTWPDLKEFLKSRFGSRKHQNLC